MGHGDEEVLGKLALERMGPVLEPHHEEAAHQVGEVGDGQHAQRAIEPKLPCSTPRGDNRWLQ